MPRKDRAAPSATEASLSDFFLKQTVEKWAAPPPIHEINLARYRGECRLYNPDGTAVTNWHTELTDADGNVVEVINNRMERTGESMAEGALAFFREVTKFQPRPYQVEVVRRLFTNRRLCVRAPRKAGKSAIKANIVIYFVTVHDVCKVITTAGSWQQLEEFLWPEIHLWVGKADWTLVGRKPKVNLLDMSFGGSEDGITKPPARAFAIRSDEPEKMEGAHSENVLIVFDEAKVIEAPTFDAVEGTLAGDNTFALCSSTPGGPNGRFYEIQTRQRGYEDWDVMKVTTNDLIAALEGKAQEERIKWVEQRRAQWGENSAMFRNHVLAEFADVDDAAVIPLEWLEAAQERWRRWRDAGFPEEWTRKPQIKVLAADIAGAGKDRTCFAKRIGYGVKEIEYFHQADTMKTASQIMSLGLSWPGVHIEVDGSGAPVRDRLRQIQGEGGGMYAHVKITSIVSGGKCEKTDVSGELGFADNRSYMWWHMREMLDPTSGFDLMLPDDSILTRDLTLPTWELNGAKIKVEKKDDIRKRNGGKSTDCGDAVIFAFADDTTQVVVQSVKVNSTTDRSTRLGATFYDPYNPRRASWERAGYR